MVETSMAEMLQENENSVIGMTYVIDYIAQNSLSYTYYKLFLPALLKQ